MTLILTDELGQAPQRMIFPTGTTKIHDLFVGRNTKTNMELLKTHVFRLKTSRKKHLILCLKQVKRQETQTEYFYVEHWPLRPRIDDCPGLRFTDNRMAGNHWKLPSRSYKHDVWRKVFPCFPVCLELEKKWAWEPSKDLHKTCIVRELFHQICPVSSLHSARVVQGLCKGWHKETFSSAAGRFSGLHSMFSSCPGPGTVSVGRGDLPGQWRGCPKGWADEQIGMFIFAVMI